MRFGGGDMTASSAKRNGNSERSATIMDTSETMKTATLITVIIDNGGH